MHDDRLEQIKIFFEEKIPHIQVMGMQIIDLSAGKASVCLETQAFMLGNPQYGLLNGGVISSLIDTASGVAVCTLTSSEESIATLDLRIDNLRPALLGESLIAEAECYRLTPKIAFVQATAFQSNRQKPIARGQLTFIRKASAASRTRSSKQ